MKTFEIIITAMTDEELQNAYAENKNARWNNPTTLIEEQASLQLEMLFDAEISRRAKILIAKKLNDIVANLNESI